MLLNDFAAFHFIGIAGTGMSALAKVLLDQGRAVSDSDIKGGWGSVEVTRAGRRGPAIRKRWPLTYGLT